MFLGTSNCHIEQTAFLLQLTSRHRGYRTWEDVLFQANHKHRGKLQAFRSMHRHQRHTRLILLSFAIRIRQQSHILQVIGEESLVHTPLLSPFLHKSRHTAQKLFQVLLSCQVVGIFARHNILADATLLDDGITQLVDIRGMRAVYERANEQPKVIQLSLRTLVYTQPIMLRLADYLPEANLILMRTVGNLVHGRGTDATSWIVDDTLDGLLIVRIGNQSEVSDNVLDFLTLIETQAAIDAIRDALLAKLLLEATALGVGAIKDGKVAILATILTLDALDVFRYDNRLFLITIGWLVLQLLTLGILAEHILRYLVAIMANEAVGSLNDGLGRAIVLFEFEELGTLQLLLKVQDVVDVGTTETIDTLRVIAHGTHTLLLLAELHHDRHLHVVGILVLIHQDIVETLGILAAYLLILLEKLEGQRQQVIKIHGIGLLASLLVSHKYLAYLWHLGTLVLLIDGLVAGIALGTHKIVLSHRNLGVNSSRLIILIAQSHLLDDSLDQRTRVGLIINGKIVVEADVFSLSTEDAGKDAMKGTHI